MAPDNEPLLPTSGGSAVRFDLTSGDGGGAKQRTARMPVSRSATARILELSELDRGGEGVQLMLAAREEKGCLCFRNAYWRVSLFTLRGRAVPWLQLIIYSMYTALVCLVIALFPDESKKLQLSQLNSVVSSIGVALFLLLAFRNNVAYGRWQSGMEKFQAFCGRSAALARTLVGALPAYYCKIPQEAAVEIATQRMKWIMAAIEFGRQTLRRQPNQRKLLDILSPEEIAEVQTAHDPVLYCFYRCQQAGSHVVTPMNAEWAMAGAEATLGEYGACCSIYHTPLPFAYIAHLRTFLVLWLAAVPWLYVSSYGWYTLFFTLLIGYGIIGVEEAAVEVEQPFGTDFNDIPMDSIVANAYESIGTYVRILRAMKTGKDSGTAKDAAPGDKANGGAA